MWMNFKITKATAKCFQENKNKYFRSKCILTFYFHPNTTSFKRRWRRWKKKNRIFSRFRQTKHRKKLRGTTLPQHFLLPLGTSFSFRHITACNNPVIQKPSIICNWDLIENCCLSAVLSAVLPVVPKAFFYSNTI